MNAMALNALRGAGAASLGAVLGVLLIAGCSSARRCGSCPLGGGSDKACAVRKAEAEINTAGLKALLAAKAAVTLLDARSGKYDDGRRLPGALALNEASPEAEVATALPDKNALVVTYCAGLTCGASHKLAERLRSMGYANVVEYPDGIAGWTEAGNPVDKAK